MDVSVRGNRPLCTGKGACIAHGISESLSDEPLDLKSDIKEGQSIKIRLKFKIGEIIKTPRYGFWPNDELLMTFHPDVDASPSGLSIIYILK